MDDKQGFQPDDIKFERRKFKRINRSYIVSYAHLEGEELKFDVSQTKNLSEGGLLFIADRAFEKDVMLKIKLRLPEFSDYVAVKAQVVASQRLAKGMMYGVRVKFVDMEQNVRDSIKRLAGYA